MAQTWETTAGVLRDLVETVPNLAKRTAALAVTGQGDGTWLIDEAGEPAAPAWLWLDSRAASLVDDMRKSEAGQHFYARTGSGLNACMQGAHLAWLDQNAPDVLGRTATAMHCKDWLYLKLTGVRATDPSEGVFGFGDYRGRKYTPEILDLLGLERHKRLLPPIVDGMTTQHPLGPDAAAATGLSVGTPVVLAYVDIVCTVLGGGLYHPKRSFGCTVLGTTGIHMRLAHGAKEVTLNDAQTGYTICFPAPDA